MFSLNPFIADPIFCAVSAYSCQLLDGPVTDFDLCDYEDDYTSSHFDTKSGGFVFRSTNMAEIPPGLYTFSVTGELTGITQASVLFYLTLVDPCLTTELKWRPEETA